MARAESVRRRAARDEDGRVGRADVKGLVDQSQDFHVCPECDGEPRENHKHSRNTIALRLSSVIQAYAAP